MEQTEIKPTNLNFLFIDQIANFAHLVKTETQSKEQFLEAIKNTYCLSNPKTNLFYIATEKSIFDTIRLNNTRSSILFNQ
jgi:hypothetical protein